MFVKICIEEMLKEILRVLLLVLKGFSMNAKTIILGTVMSASTILSGCQKKNAPKEIMRYTPQYEQKINAQLDSLNRKDVIHIGGRIPRDKYFDTKDRLIQEKIKLLDLKYQEIVYNLQTQIDSLKSLVGTKK